MIREEDEDAMDPDSRTENDGKRQHDAEFYRDDKVEQLTALGWDSIDLVYMSASPPQDQRGNEEDNGNDVAAVPEENAGGAPDVVPMDVD